MPFASLVRDPTKRRSMSEAGRRKALAEFDQDRVIDITLDTYERPLDQLGKAVRW